MTPIHVLFLCTHNSARSIVAEALLNHLGHGRFKAFSAGSSPREHSQPHPIGLEVLRAAGIATDGLSSKRWDVFATPDAPPMDLVITVCDNAAGEVCPCWPGHPATAHWSYADPSAAGGDAVAQREAFRHTMQLIRQRLEQFISLPPERLDRASLQQAARELASRTPE
jgi:arsenate reductase